MKTKIQNIGDLKARLITLRIRRNELENDFQHRSDSITEKFRMPTLILNKINDWLNSFAGGPGKTTKGQVDWITNLFSVGLPMMMNRFFFPKSGIVMKAVLSLLSQRAAKTVNLDVFSDVFAKVKHWVSTPAKSKPKAPVLQDYGIPPDSETF